MILVTRMLPFLLVLPAAWSAPKPVPTFQVLPLPHHQISLQRNGAELTRYHYAPDQNRPFLYPINGPSGRSLTRMGHPHDPESHSHHNSFWVSHHAVNGIRFWDDRGKGRIRHRRVLQFEDGPEACSAEVFNEWVAENQTLLEETRRMTVQGVGGEDWWLILDLHFRPKSGQVTFEKTPFGMVGVRMAKTIGVRDGGGTIRNSGGGRNEEGVFWKPARWVDYSGPIAPGTVEGITLMDHPSNPRHPAVFHVRDDGWMGASLTFAKPMNLEPGQTLRLRYGLYVHQGMPEADRIEEVWQRFAQTRPPARP